MRDIQALPVDQISIPPRLRRPLQLRVQALAASIDVHGQDTPIEVVETDKGFELIAGEHRLAAIKYLGRDTIDARVFGKDELKTVHDKRLREIRENMERFELNPLERAGNIAAWRESFEALTGRVKTGPTARGKAVSAISANLTLIDYEEMSATFALNFSEAAQETFGLSRRAVFRALQIARIDPDIRDRLADHPIAEKQSELLNLANAPAEHHGPICDLLIEATDPLTVAEALAIITETPKPRPMQDWEKTSAHFSRLHPRDQSRFFELHVDAIELWLAKRAGKRGK